MKPKPCKLVPTEGRYQVAMPGEVVGETEHEFRVRVIGESMVRRFSKKTELHFLRRMREFPNYRLEVEE